MKKVMRSPDITERVRVKQPGSPKTFKETLVNHYLVDWGKDQQEAGNRAIQQRTQALAWARTFFELNEVQFKDLGLFELAGRAGVEHNGVAVIPLSPGSAALVFPCPFCLADTASQSAATTLADLGRLIYEESKGALEPDQEHVLSCSAAPKSAIHKPEAILPESGVDVIQMLAVEIAKRMGTGKK